jgi:hypothetical protein
MTKLRTLVLEYDLIEIHYNENLKNNPYLVRVFSYNAGSDIHDSVDNHVFDGVEITVTEEWPCKL